MKRTDANRFAAVLYASVLIGCGPTEPSSIDATAEFDLTADRPTWEIIDLGSPPGSASGAQAWDINRSNEILAQVRINANGVRRAVIRKVDGTWLELEPLAGDDATFGIALNGAGIATGLSLQGATFSNLRAVVWSHDGGPTAIPGFLHPLDASQPTAIADDGAVVGFADFVGSLFPVEVHAFYWKPGLMSIVDLGTLGGSQSAPFDVNANGVVVGESYNAQFVNQAFVQRVGRRMQSIGVPPGFDQSTAWLVNDRGQVLGSAFSVATFRSSAWRWTQAEGIAMLPKPKGAIAGHPAGIDRFGHALVTYEFAEGSFVAYFVETGNRVTKVPIPESGATPIAMNQCGDLVGTARDPVTRVGRLVLWKRGC